MEGGIRRGIKLSNRNYISGRTFEYRVLYYFRKLGFYCLRAYGSKGLYDIIAIPPQRKEHFHNYPLLIQCKKTKNGYVAPTELKKLKENQKWQAFHIIAWSDKGKLRFRTVDGVELANGAIESLT